MKILAIDTTGGACSVAVLKDERVICEQFIHDKLTHSVHLMRLVDNCMKLTGLEIRDFDVFAVTSGPGSFTGIRIGMCAVKGFCQVTGKPAAAVDTLEALSACVPQSGLVVPIMDARREQVYTAVFKDGRRMTEDMAIPVEELLQKLSGEDVLFIGDGVDAYADIITQKYANARFAPENIRYQRASAVAHIAAKQAERGELVSCEKLIPNYLRMTQAERVREENKNA